MSESSQMQGYQPRDVDRLFGVVVEILVRSMILLGLFFLSLLILLPFFLPVLWGCILATSCYPAYNMLCSKVGERRKLGAILTTLGLILILLVPCVFLGDSLYRGIQAARGSWEQGQISFPPPPPQLRSWPLIGERLYTSWELASVNIGAALRPFATEIRSAFASVLGAAAGIGFTLVQLVFAIFVAGVLLATSESCSRMLQALLIRLDDTRGRELLGAATVTVRNVAKGIIGIAFLQALLAGIGMTVAGVPAAGLWTLLALILGILQVGVGPVLLGAVVYLFSTSATWSASLLLLWSLIVGPLDNILKPLLLGKGAPVPTLVIFLGSLGGFLRFGLIGLFVGAVILAMAYKLFVVWVEGPKDSSKVPDMT